TLSANFQVGQGTYALSPRGALVLLKSLHRLVWPWGYLILVAVLLSQRGQLHRRTLAWAALIPITMLPYIFVSYTDNIPSRQTYLASAVLTPLLAAGILSFKTKGWRVGLATAFVLFNVIYMWRVKDPQMEYRALPTTVLLNTLRTYAPQEILLRGFEYPVNLIPKSVAVSLPGWQWDQVDIEGECGNCLVLEWSRAEEKYSERHDR
ncbi:MAG TPA: hypothetical protein VFR05_09140, partial [Terriglobia bacterium]|nr:hypothetical protein [Terriglobia bacterium]